MEWNIQQPAKICVNCSSQFKDKDTCHSFLRLDGTEVLRRDFCGICFGGMKDNLTHDHNEAYWKSRYALIIPVIKEDPIKKDRVEQLLREYLAGDIQGFEKICYLLTVMLERKKILKLRKTFVGSDGKKIFNYEHTKTGESFSIPDPALAISEIPVLQKQVQELLSSVPIHQAGQQRPAEHGISP